MNASHEASCEGTTKAGMTYESSSEELGNLGAKNSAANVKKRSKKAGLKSETLLEKHEQSLLEFKALAAKKLCKYDWAPANGVKTPPSIE